MRGWDRANNSWGWASSLTPRGTDKMADDDGNGLLQNPDP